MSRSPTKGSRRCAGLRRCRGPGTPVTLAPGGTHIMLMGLKQPFRAGDSFPVTLGFEGSGQVTSTVTVQPMRGAASTGSDAIGRMTMPGRPH